MFAWLLIGIELAFLYFAYWFVFVREPKNYQIEGQLWGGYDGRSVDDTNRVFEENVLGFPEFYGQQSPSGALKNYAGYSEYDGPRTDPTRGGRAA